MFSHTSCAWSHGLENETVRVCVCVCVRARACVCVCVRTCVRVCVVDSTARAACLVAGLEIHKRMTVAYNGLICSN